MRDTESITTQTLIKDLISIFLNNKKSTIFQNGFDFNDKDVIKIFQKLLSKNIIDLRIVNTLNSSKLVKIITDFLSSKVVEGQKQSSKLRDLELSLKYQKDVHKILEALSDNY